MRPAQNLCHCVIILFFDTLSDSEICLFFPMVSLVVMLNSVLPTACSMGNWRPAKETLDSCRLSSQSFVVQPSRMWSRCMVIWVTEWKLKWEVFGQSVFTLDMYRYSNVTTWAEIQVWRSSPQLVSTDWTLFLQTAPCSSTGTEEGKDQAEWVWCNSRKEKQPFQQV